jgi:hypothetical protein
LPLVPAGGEKMKKILSSLYKRYFLRYKILCCWESYDGKIKMEKFTDVRKDDVVSFNGHNYKINPLLVSQKHIKVSFLEFDMPVVRLYEISQ